MIIYHLMQGKNQDRQAGTTKSWAQWLKKQTKTIKYD